MSLDLHATLELIEGVEGWLSPDQAAELHRAAAQLVAGDTVVEIGSFRGRSAIVLARAAPEGVEVVAIDPHAGNDRGPQEIDGFEQAAADDHSAFLANLAAAGVAHRVRHVRAMSDAAHGEVQGDVALLYVDGAHRYGPARRDLRDWGGRVGAGGTMLVHDSFSSVGVTLAIGRELLLGRKFRYVRRARSLAVYSADLDPSRWAQVSNALRQLAQLPWFGKNLLTKALLTLGMGRMFERFGRPRPEWPY